MSDGSFTTTVSAAGLAPSQRSQLDQELRAEGIPVTWLGDSIQIDHAFESRVESLVAGVRSNPATATATGPSPAPGGFVPTATGPLPMGSYPPPAPGYPPPAPGYPPAPYGGYYRPPVTNSNATLSLVLAIVGWLVCPIASIFGVVYGRRALDEIDASGGTQGGEGLAKAGLIGSWIILGIYGLMIVGFIVFFIIFGIVGVAASAT